MSRTVGVPDTDEDERAFRGHLEALTFRFRGPILVLYLGVAVGVAYSGTREDSDFAILTVPSFAFACLVGYLFPSVGFLLPLGASALGYVVGSYGDGIENEASGINLIGGLLIAELCVISGSWNRRRRQRAIADWQARNRP